SDEKGGKGKEQKKKRRIYLIIVLKNETLEEQMSANASSFVNAHGPCTLSKYSGVEPNSSERAVRAADSAYLRRGIIKKDISLKNLHFKKGKEKKKACETYRGTPPQLKSTPGVESLEASNRDTVSVSPSSPSHPQTTPHPIQASPHSRRRYHSAGVSPYTHGRFKARLTRIYDFDDDDNEDDDDDDDNDDDADDDDGDGDDDDDNDDDEWLDKKKEQDVRS
ncbi:hypothetical protein V1478_017312, partial [Vespula squamosa]